MSKGYARIGQYKNAYEKLAEAEEMVNEFLKRNIDAEGQRWTKRYELEKKDFEIQQQAQKRQFARWLALLMLLLTCSAVAVTCWLWREERRMRRKNRALIQKIEVIEHYRSEVSQLRVSARQRLDSKHAADKISDTEILDLMDEKTVQEELYLKPHFSLEEMARTLNLSAPRLQLFFRQSAEYKRLEDYFDSKRIVRACVILRSHPGQTIQSVAFDSGFPTVKTFNRKFKGIMKMTPSEYRKAVLN